MTTISTQGLIPEQELIKRPIAVEVGGVVHLGHYSIRNGMIRVTYGSSCKPTQLGGMFRTPQSWASHGSDAWRYLSLSWPKTWATTARAPMREPEEEKKAVGVPLTDLTHDQFFEIEDPPLPRYRRV